MDQFFHFIMVAALCCIVTFGNVAASADTEALPAPACPLPDVSQKEWGTFSDVKVGINLRLPKKYREKHWAVTVGDYVGTTLRAGHYEDLSFTVEDAEGRSLEQHKVTRQRDYEGYTECTGKDGVPQPLTVELADDLADRFGGKSKEVTII